MDQPGGSETNPKREDDRREVVHPGRIVDSQMGMAMSSRTHWRPSLYVAAYSLVFLLCILPVFYFVFLREVDASLCYRWMGGRLGVSGDYYGVATYIHDSLRQGMSRSEAHDQLSRFGKVTVTQEDFYTWEEVSSTELINLGTCFHPSNHMHMIIRYDQNGRLLSAQISDD